MKEIKRYTWHNTYKEAFMTFEWCKSEDVDKLITDHKAVVETQDKIIENLKVEKLMILREQVNETISMQKRIEELEGEIKEYYDAETLKLITKFDN